MGTQDAQDMAEAIIAADQAQETTPAEPTLAPAEPAEPVAAPPAEEAEFTDADRAAMSKAIKAEREQRKAIEEDLKRFRAAEEEAKKASMTELERAVAEAKASARAELEAEYKAQLLKTKVEAKAGAKFHDPEIVISLLDIDADASDAEVDEALAALAESRPYLVKHAVPNLPQGPRGEGAGMQKSMDDVFREALLSRR
jgi:hypothetical protein